MPKSLSINQIIDATLAGIEQSQKNMSLGREGIGCGKARNT